MVTDRNSGHFENPRNAKVLRPLTRTGFMGKIQVIQDDKTIQGVEKRAKKRVKK
jgi:hypothetical protein